MDLRASMPGVVDNRQVGAGAVGIASTGLRRAEPPTRLGIGTAQHHSIHTKYNGLILQSEPSRISRVEAAY